LSRAGLSVAQANLEKTIIRAPLSGNLNSLSLKRGDFVQAYTPVASIANNGSLEMVAYLNEQDASLVKVGQSVKINNENSGVVTKIAPALDSLTKKIEIKIAIVDGGKLVNGQSANISIPVSKDKIISNNQSISIPLSSLKILSDRMVIFTVDYENKLVSHDVKIGRLLGDRVEILSGLTNDMKIVEDARGLRDGEIVVVK
jgi:RND family efflux transporter MFP subunit